MARHRCPSKTVRSWAQKATFGARPFLFFAGFQLRMESVQSYVLAKTSIRELSSPIEKESIAAPPASGCRMGPRSGKVPALRRRCAVAPRCFVIFTTSGYGVLHYTRISGCSTGNESRAVHSETSRTAARETARAITCSSTTAITCSSPVLVVNCHLPGNANPAEPAAWFGVHGVNGSFRGFGLRRQRTDETRIQTPLSRAEEFAAWGRGGAAHGGGRCRHCAARRGRNWWSPSNHPWGAALLRGGGGGRGSRLCGGGPIDPATENLFQMGGFNYG